MYGMTISCYFWFCNTRQISHIRIDYMNEHSCAPLIYPVYFRNSHNCFIKNNETVERQVFFNQEEQ